MTLNERNEKIEAHNQRAFSKIIDFELPKNGQFKNLSGLVFERLSVISYAGKTKSGNKYYWTKCKCGSIKKLVQGNAITSGNTNSCGCLNSEKISKRRKTHGLTNDPWYTRSLKQQQRMMNPNEESYKWYGGDGLEFGEGMETIEKRILFYREKFGLEPPEKLEIDRINNDIGYAKDNVRLISHKDNMQNTRCYHGLSRSNSGKESRIYSCWKGNKRRETLCDEWAADFKVFLADIGGKDLPKGKYLARYDVEKPFGPDNYYFSDTIQRRPSYLMPK